MGIIGTYFTVYTWWRWSLVTHMHCVRVCIWNYINFESSLVFWLRSPLLFNQVEKCFKDFCVDWYTFVAIFWNLHYFHLVEIYTCLFEHYCDYRVGCYHLWVEIFLIHWTGFTLGPIHFMILGYFLWNSKCSGNCILFSSRCSQSDHCIISHKIWLLHCCCGIWENLQRSGIQELNYSEHFFMEFEL